MTTCLSWVSGALGRRSPSVESSESELEPRSLWEITFQLTLRFLQQHDLPAVCADCVLRGHRGQ